MSGILSIPTLLVVGCLTSLAMGAIAVAVIFRRRLGSLVEWGAGNAALFLVFLISSPRDSSPFPFSSDS